VANRDRILSQHQALVVRLEQHHVGVTERGTNNLDENFMFARFWDRKLVQVELVVAIVISDRFSALFPVVLAARTYCCAFIVFFSEMEPMLADLVYESWVYQGAVR
jgi:hypothetical protein